MVNIHKIVPNKCLFLAYDQGLEHGPSSDFNETNVNPEYVLDIGVKGKYNGLILLPGVAEKYSQNFLKKVPLIVKLNGKTDIAKVDPYSAQICSVSRAIKMGADAVGYTVYVGSAFESTMFKEFSKIVEEAHDHGVPVIAWMYPRGRFVHNILDTNVLAHSARAGLELGADILKLNNNDDLPGLKWVVKSAGKAKIVFSGGSKLSEPDFYKHIEFGMKAGGTGVAIGRNVWQAEDPLAVTRNLKKIVLEGKKAEDIIREATI
ncbi:fructose-bisphosphate aldolase [Candidatus Woesearchaeota archaeon]|nr:fructose-bisphosphate aldolase [Candidatus Woesearchaeota archaeon]